MEESKKNEEITGRSSRESRKGFTILHLYGSSYERGYAHGLLMKKEILSSGIADYYGSFLKILLFSSSSVQNLPVKLRSFLINAVEHFFYSPLEKNFSDATYSEVSGLADATGIKKDTILRALMAPDIMQLLISGFLRGGKNGNGNYYLGGCSAVYAREAAVKSRGKALIARNLDFPGALVWKHPVIIYNHPTDKTGQPYMYISTAGLPGTGLTGMNRSGIVMSTFICISRESSRYQMPSLDFNHVLFTALENLDDLPLLLKKMNICSSAPHSVLFADGEKAVVLETSAKGSFIREMTPRFNTLVQTNHFLSPRLKKREIEFPLERESTIERYRFLRDALEMYYGKLDPKKMVDIISSGYDRYTGKVSLTAVNSPARAETLMSTVIEPESGNFWVASGNPPGICFNRYRGFNFYSELSSKKSDKTISDIDRSKTAIFGGHGSCEIVPGGKESLKLFTLAKEQMKVGKIVKAINLLKSAIGLFEDPGYFYILSILYIRKNEPREALRIINIMKERFRYSPVRESAIPLWEGRCYDLTGQRAKALECYRAGLNTAGLIPGFRKAYEQSLKRTFTLKQFPRTLNFNNPGPVNL